MRGPRPEDSPFPRRSADHQIPCRGPRRRAPRQRRGRRLHGPRRNTPSGEPARPTAPAPRLCTESALRRERRTRASRRSPPSADAAEREPRPAPRGPLARPAAVSVLSLRAPRAPLRQLPSVCAKNDVNTDPCPRGTDRFRQTGMLGARGSKSRATVSTARSAPFLAKSTWWRVSRRLWPQSSASAVATGARASSLMTPAVLEGAASAFAVAPAPASSSGEKPWGAPSAEPPEGPRAQRAAHAARSGAAPRVAPDATPAWRGTR